MDDDETEQPKSTVADWIRTLQAGEAKGVWCHDLEAAASGLVREYDHRIQGFVRKRLPTRCPHTAADMAQRVWIIALQKIDDFDVADADRFLWWLLKIARYQSFGEGRRHQRREVSGTKGFDEIVERIVDPSLPPPEASIRVEERVELWTTVNRLPKPQRLVFKMRLRGRDYPQIATALKRSVHAVRAMQFRGVTKVRSVMASRGIGQ